MVLKKINVVEIIYRCVLMKLDIYLPVDTYVEVKKRPLEECATCRVLATCKSRWIARRT